VLLKEGTTKRVGLGTRVTFNSLGERRRGELESHLLVNNSVHGVIKKKGSGPVETVEGSEEEKKKENRQTLLILRY